MTNKEYAFIAIDAVIEFALEQGLKYRRGDFKISGIDIFQAFNENQVRFINGDENPTGVSIFLNYKFERTAKKLKSVADNFLGYKYCRVMDIGVFFNFSLSELEIIRAKENNCEISDIEKVIKKIQKLLALANNNTNESEAISASMQVQKLLAKYNLDIVDVTGEEKKEDIEHIIADVGTGKKWKYSLANAVAESYCCKCYYHGAEQIIFYGYQSDALIARRVYIYLFKVGHNLATKYVKKSKKEINRSGTGIYNSFCSGFCNGVKRELERNCKALALITPKEVTKSFDVFSQNFKKIDTNIDSIDRNAYKEGEVEGRRALNAQYIEK